MSTTISGTNGVTFPDSTSMQTGQQACKAWVSFNGEGTVAIRGSYNVSSITDNGTGNFTVNFTVAMPDTNYAALATTEQSDGSTSTFAIGNLDNVSPRTVNAVSFLTQRSNGDNQDTERNDVAIFSN